MYFGLNSRDKNHKLDVDYRKPHTCVHRLLSKILQEQKTTSDTILNPDFQNKKVSLNGRVLLY